jgi:putative ABC transport system permease protein
MQAPIDWKWTQHMVDSFAVEDIRAAIRALWRRPATSHWSLFGLVGALATSTAIMTVATIVLLRPLPFPDAESLVYVKSLPQDASPIRSRPSGVSWATWQALRKLPAFRGVGAWTRESVLLTRPSRDVIETWKVSASLLPILGVKPAVGRLFTADEDTAVPHGAALISWDCWQRRFGGRDDILGQTLELSDSYIDNRVRTIVGVFPRAVALQGRLPEVILPLGVPLWSSSDAPSLHLVARLASPDALEAARSGASEFVPLLTKAKRPLKAQVVRVADDVFGEPAETSLLGLAALIVLIIAVGSAATIATSDIVERRGELAVRLAIGATPQRLLMQSAVQQAILTLAALAIAGPIAFWLVRYAIATLLPSLAVVGVSVADWKAFPLALLITTSAIMVATALPSFVVARWLMVRPLASSLQWATSRLAGRHRILLGAQLAACLTLVVCACLLEQTVWRLASQPLGFDPEDLVVVSFTPTKWPSDAAGNRLSIFKTAAYVDALVESVRRLPGVAAGAAVRDAPFASAVRTAEFVLPGNDVPLWVQAQGVSNTYFQTMRLRLVAGRLFEHSDNAWSPKTGTVNVIVSESLARQLDRPALGAKLFFGSQQQPHVVIGIVGDVTQENYRDHALPAIYVPPNTFDSFESLILRFSPGTTVSAAAIRRAMQEFDPTIVVTAVHPVTSLLERSLAVEVLRARSAELFGSAAVFLAVTGLYATGRRAAEQRRSECAIRLALGAGTTDIARLLGRDALVAAVIGLVIGMPLSLTAAYGLRHVLFGVSAMQPLALAVGVACLVCAVIMAMARPIWRMAQIEPFRVLREQ